MITGKQNPLVGITEYYKINDVLGSNIFSGDNVQYFWYLWRKQKDGKWLDITKKDPKSGLQVTYKFGETFLGTQFKIQVFKATKNGLTQKFDAKLFAELPIVPTSNKIAQIERVVLFNGGASDVNKAHYRDTLTARAYCTAMFNQTVEFHLWEDDAPKGGHNPAINQHNRYKVPFPAKVNEKGIAEVQIKLVSHESILKSIANKYVMKGDKNEGKNHEFYVTASYSGKIKNSSQVNVDVANPDYKKDSPKSQPKAPAKKPEKKKTNPQPRQDTYKKPLPNNKPATGKNSQSDKDGRIIDVNFKNRAGKKITTTPKFGETIIIEILTKNVIGKHYYLRVWEDDTFGKHDLLYEGIHKISSDQQLVTFALTKGRQQIGEIGNDPKNPDSGEYTMEVTDHQELFAEIAFADISKESTRLTVEVLEEYKSPEYKKAAAKVKMLPKQEPKKGECFCNRKFEDKEVANIIKQLRILTGHKDTVNLWYKQTTPKMDDKSLAGFVKELNANFNHYNIKTCSQKMHFLAHACVETGAFSKAREGGTDLSYDPWRGHGLLQLTKEAAYEKYNAKENKNLVAKPEKIAENLHLTVDSGCWTWSEFKKMPSDVESKAIKRWGKVTAGKSLNQLALYGDKYLELISALLNGRNAKTDMPNGWEERKAAYDHLRNFIFKYDYYHGGKSKQVNAKDIVTYHIYANGDIEKHIPKKIKEEYEQKYKFIYHDEGNAEHELCIATWHTTTKKLFSGRKLYSKPTHNRIISDKNVSDGQTTRRVIYENGDIAEYGSNDGDTFWRLYSSTSEKIELVEMPENVKYVKYSFSGTQRRYTGPNYFAGFLGALAKLGLSVVTTGSCFKYGSCFPSQFHVNGESVDTSYFWDLKKDQLFVDAMRSFHYGEVKVGAFNGRKHGAYFSSLKNVSDGGTLHNSHFHSGKFNILKIKIIKE